MQVVDLVRRFGDAVAVDAVSFTVAPGRLTGFVGGNGAGKTTTMRMIMGVLATHGGHISWQGRPITAADRRTFGYMPEERGLYPKQPVLDQLVYIGRLHGMTAAAARGSALAHLERFGLADRAKDVVEKLSLGNQQRVQIVAAVLTGPNALILDEPFSGLDPMAVDSMADLLREHTSRGVPVLFSSHQLDLVERLCDDLVILARGRVVASGTTEELRATGQVRYRLVVDHDAGWTRSIRGVHVCDVDGSTAVIELRQSGVERDLLTEALRRGTVHEFCRVVPSISEIFREVSS
ncbi:MAG TPA: ATP-binding cassette domain-containing protein [Dermatophilaceae bacterium]|nr:ATP-binding cassette domain-containing protein [Dermatophilaceae bacterium]